jgi:autotransporter-associated beta strand protein
LGTLILSADNAYSGGTTLKAGALDLIAHCAAGTGTLSNPGSDAITFKGKATLEIANAALSGNSFDNPIVNFGKHDILDLSGLHFHAAGAAAIYDSTTQHLVVHSGIVNDTLTLLSPKGLSFSVANDGHGGTKVTLDPPHAATVASEATHHSDGSAQHLGDYLWIG